MLRLGAVAQRERRISRFAQNVAQVSLEILMGVRSSVVEQVSYTHLAAGSNPAAPTRFRP